MLKGWAFALPQFVVDAIEAGKVTVHYDAKLNAELLRGEATAEDGTVVAFKPEDR